MTKKIKRIIAQALLLTMLMPNIVSGATENIVVDGTNTDIERVEENDASGDNSNITSEKESEVTEGNELKDNEQEEVEGSLDSDVKEEPQEETKEEAVDEEQVELEDNTIESQDETEDIQGSVEDIQGSVYEEVKVDNGISTYSVIQEEREEFRLTREAMKDYTVLKNKTEEEYEVAFAYSDGTYRFVDASDSYEDAMNILASTPIPTSDDEVIPVIIGRSGQVVYSTNSMGIVIKHINGGVDPTFNNNSNIYITQDMKSAYTYVNHGYVKDVPIIEEGRKSARIQVNGYTGWMNKDVTSGNYDLEIVPVNQITNPSYYVSEGGVLYHYISTNPKAVANTSGSKIAIGVAPSYMAAGTRYLSYDGNYFYNGSNISSGLNALINDLKAGNKNNSINSNNPYYNYYQYLPFRSKTTYSAAQLNGFISSQTAERSKLRNAGQALKDAEKNYGVNALLALGIAINESGWGMSSISQSKNNIFGLNAVDSNPGLAANEFPSVAACINDFSKNWISSGYADPADWRFYGGFLGNKNLGVNIKYASDPFWGEKASKYAFQCDLQLSGNVSNLQDTNAYQLAMYTSSNEVRNKNNTLLYKVSQNFDTNASYVGVPFIITNPDKMNINGRISYEIYSDRNTPATNGKYHGNYDWSNKGYINASGVKLINSKRNVSPPVEVLGGATRFETAVKLSASKFNTAKTVVLVNYEAIIDGITASALATALNSPILLAHKDNMPESIKQEIKRLGATQVILIGGTTALSSRLENQVRSLGISNITRLGGANRYDTALEIAKYIDSNCYDVSEVFLVNGLGEADALSAGAISGQNRVPILLTTANAMTERVRIWLSGEDLYNGYVIGGTTVMSNNVIKQLNSMTKRDVANNRLGGLNRYDTNAKIIDNFYGSKLNSVYVSKGLELVDALTAGPIAAIDGSPIVLVGNNISDSQRAVLSKRHTSRIIQAGLGVSQGAINSLRNVLNIYDL